MRPSGGADTIRAALPTLARVTAVVVRVSAPSNITLSGLQAPNGLDGVTPLVEGDLVLVNNQTDKSQNAVYVASANAWRKLGKVKCVCVTLGTLNADSLFFLATSPVNTYLKLQTGGGTTIVKAASTAGVTLSGPQTVDTVSCGDNDKVLVKDNGGAANGVYIAKSTIGKAWDFQGQPSSVAVSLGAVNKQLGFFLASTPANTYLANVGVYG